MNGLFRDSPTIGKRRFVEIATIRKSSTNRTLAGVLRTRVRVIVTWICGIWDESQGCPGNAQLLPLLASDPYPSSIRPSKKAMMPKIKATSS